ncbi:Na+/H+ antiporter NhaA [Elizabethkingia meningoseptica]|uniref:Na(+)/H(+) antiporter NhaA n=1 Tax=Elizabethkingia meningoseptica TaxID=238 RepID=A0A1V3U017_ELIME|nr:MULTISPECIES: Na+/H+ antiporter NhaA [Elizabethkingia]AQX05661.1 Na+/H+ antiporter NhaA [Elizabethkingia meningoseptica]AQX13209.1 Na+/H+ antiporter NhaA [Elizabethkingia meningoseptica]AQX47704.1 sodium:proton antiporter [Elizabethkingia meningoseptica]EJK5328926.1 Na+/H+ antiporter NhaA [Elizabethkingia meningoseptica]EOR30673.1 Na+/H+ antiporter NhaA [Elizabethkingia meningoseptica ATCC 13253 = NBRC 12535]
MKLTQYFKKFFESSQSSGILLILCVLVSLFIANSSLGTGFQNALDSHLGPYSVSEWINDGLMTIFFLLVGLEIKREMLEGELSNVKNASLPIFAAIGGMLVPALIYAYFNQGTEYAKGWGIPMATDIAFSLAIISMLSKRVPASIKIFLAALAIVDDLGAILVIAIFYTEQLHWIYLIISGGILILLFLFNRFGVKKHIYYLIPGAVLWYCMHHSGIHATIAGVLLAFTIPTNESDTEISPLEKLEGILHTPVNYLIMPVFALANTNIVFHTGMVDGLFTNFGAGIIGGLIAGKLTGILLFCFIAIKLGISKLPQNANWSQMAGVGLLAGIGFTMSIFIAILSFKGHQEIQDEAKFAILVASTLAGFAGYIVLKFASKKKKQLA